MVYDHLRQLQSQEIMGKQIKILFLLFFASCQSQDHTEFYDSGELQRKVEILSDKNSNEFHYYKNGNLKIEFKLRDGEIDGIVKEYYASGKLYSSCTYLNGNKEGVRIYYYENESIKAKNLFKADSLYYVVSIDKDSTRIDLIKPIIEEKIEKDSLIFNLEIPRTDHFPYKDDSLYVIYDFYKDKEDFFPKNSKLINGSNIKLGINNGLNNYNRLSGYIGINSDTIIWNRNHKFNYSIKN